jgi:phosphatidylserine decarboxylase
LNIAKTIIETIKVPIHPAGYPFIGIFVTLTLLMGFFFGKTFLFIGIVLSIWCVYFFRNPIRFSPQKQSLVLAPADGRILSIIESKPPTEMCLKGERWTRIAIFMNVFDVHVNRSPMSGRVVNKSYFPGSFLNASLDKASIKNERLSLTLETDYGIIIGIVQIAGLVARRILCQTFEDQRLAAGEQFGIIRFGSRVDVWLPGELNVKVLQGQRTYAGETILADYQSKTDIGKVRVE